MATQAKFNTVLPSNTIQQGLNYTGVSSVYASKLNTLGQAENVMTANDVELSLNTYNPGSTASINIPASYKLLGNMYLKLTVSLRTLLNAPTNSDSQSYKEIYDASIGSDSLIFSNCPSVINTLTPFDETGPTRGTPNNVELGSLNTGLPMDINFLAYQLIKQFTYRIPGCDRIYIQGIHMLPWLLDKCPNEEEKTKLAIMSGSSQFLYNYNMKSGLMRQQVVNLKNTVTNYDLQPYIAQAANGDPTEDNPNIILNSIENPEFVIYALLPLPWTTIDKEKNALYYPSHMTTSALELNIQFQDANYMKVPAETGYSGYQVVIKDASLRFTYAQVATLTYYKPPIYKLPCSLPYGFVFPVRDYHQADVCSVNLLGLKNGEITQLQMFMHQQSGGSFTETITNEDLKTTSGSMRYKWRNEPLRNVQVEYAGQIIWKGLDDNFDLMNQFDNRKGWSSFKFPSMLTTKTRQTAVPDSGSVGLNNIANGTLSSSFQRNALTSEYFPTYNRGVQPRARWVVNTGDVANLTAFNAAITPHSLYYTSNDVSLSNFVDITNSDLSGYIAKGFLDEPTGGTVAGSLKSEIGIGQYMRSLFSNSFYPSSSTLPFGKTTAWDTLYSGVTDGSVIFGFADATKCKAIFDAFTGYNFGDQFYWTTIPVAEKIDQIRGPRDYNLGADFKDSNLIAKFSGYDSLRSTRANISVSELSKRVRWDLHLIISITSAFIFNGDRAELMQ